MITQQMIDDLVEGTAHCGYYQCASDYGMIDADAKLVAAINKRDKLYIAIIKALEEHTDATD